MVTTQPRKQRKAMFGQDLHTLKMYMRAHLSKSLREKYGKRSSSVKKGDEVKIMRGKFTDSSGVVERIDLRNRRVYIEGIQIPKADGTKAKVGVVPSNIMITKLDLNDKARKEKFEAPKAKDKEAKA
jgi:large subunit ribosomal protein L24